MSGGPGEALEGAAQTSYRFGVFGLFYTGAQAPLYSDLRPTVSAHDDDCPGDRVTARRAESIPPRTPWTCPSRPDRSGRRVFGDRQAGLPAGEEYRGKYGMAGREKIKRPLPSRPPALSPVIPVKPLLPDPPGSDTGVFEYPREFYWYYWYYRQVFDGRSRGAGTGSGRQSRVKMASGHRPKHSVPP
jgi:hypothetical protein